MSGARKSPGLTGLFFDLKVVVTVVASLLLAGCLSSSSGAVARTVEAFISDRRAATFSDDEIIASGLGVLEVSINDRAPISMILGGLDSDSFVMSFYSQDRARIDLINGYVVRTRGFQSDLLERVALGPNPFERGLHQLDSLRSFYWKVSFANGPRGLIAESRYERVAESQIRLRGRLVTVSEMIEYWMIPELEIQLENRFFYDRDGIVVSSRQTVGAGVPVFETRLRSYNRP